jgi:class 3 adenylate cyclase
MTKTCVSCGRQLHAKAEVCPNCGQGQPASSPAKSDKSVPEWVKDLEWIKKSKSNPYSGYSGDSGFSRFGYSGLSGVTSPFGSFSETPEVQKLKKRILDLQNEVSRQAHQLNTEAADKAHKEEQLKKLDERLGELKKEQELDFLLSRVTPKAEKAILEKATLREEFFAAKEQLAFVVSIDIRRSTELMLKARTPSLFATFMTGLCGELEAVIKDEFGVFDKFTGDGVLAFFPQFFSGPDAGYHALAAAQRALAIFAASYRRHRSSFTTVLRDVNLAIGIDFGGVHLVQVAGGLTVVGNPVVYACSLSGGPPGTILLNQHAYEEISAAYGGLCFISETSLEIKHEEGVMCYELKRNNKVFEPASPSWLEKSDLGQQKIEADVRSEKPRDKPSETASPGSRGKTVVKREKTDGEVPTKSPSR